MVLLYVLSFLFIINAFMSLSKPDGSSYFVGSLVIGAILGSIASGMWRRREERKKQLDLQERLVRAEEQLAANQAAAVAGAAAPLQSYVTTSSTPTVAYSDDSPNLDSAQKPDADDPKEIDVGMMFAIGAFVIVALIIVAAVASNH